MGDKPAASMFERLKRSVRWSLSARAAAAAQMLPLLRGLLWVVAVLLAMPAIELLGLANASFVPARIANAIAQTPRVEYLLLVMLVGLGVIYIRETLLQIIWESKSGSERGAELLQPQPSDSGWIFWAAAVSGVLIATVLRLAPQNLQQEIIIHADEVVWSGAIANQERAVMGALAKGNLKRLRLKNNSGGDPAMAERVASRLDELGIEEVIVEGTCASACAHLWLLADNRTLAPFSVLGFHQGRAARQGAGVQRIPDAEASALLNSSLLAALIRAGANPGAAAQLLSADNGRMHWVGAAELSAIGVRFNLE